MTVVTPAVNLGFGPQFPAAWGRVFVIACVIAVPVIFLLAPIARKLTSGLLGVHPLKDTP